MSKATDYLVKVIAEKDQIIGSLMTGQATAWDEGWHEHYLEEVRQSKDPSHPITANNPYEGHIA